MGSHLSLCPRPGTCLCWVGLTGVLHAATFLILTVFQGIARIVTQGFQAAGRGGAVGQLAQSLVAFPGSAENVSMIVSHRLMSGLVVNSINTTGYPFRDFLIESARAKHDPTLCRPHTS